MTRNENGMLEKHLIERNLEGFGAAGQPQGEVTETNVLLDAACATGCSYEYGRHMAVLEDDMLGKYIVCVSLSANNRHISVI